MFARELINRFRPSDCFYRYLELEPTAVLLANPGHDRPSTGSVDYSLFPPLPMVQLSGQIIPDSPTAGCE
jgi:hypothetical protein